MSASPKLSVLVLLALVCALAPAAWAGTLEFQYSREGDLPGTAWVLVTMDPIDWGPCTQCLLPDYSRIHVAPAPVQPSSGTSYPGGQRYLVDETGASITGDGYVREILLDVTVPYVIDSALTRREGFNTGQGGSCAGDYIACTYEVTDYPVVEIPQVSVATDRTSLSTIKAIYRH